MSPPAVGLSPMTFRQVTDLIERRYGLFFPDQKREVLESRLRPRLCELGLDSFEAYCSHLLAYPDEELAVLAKLTTNNETYFFRERHQFDTLFGSALDGLRERPVVPGRVRMLCAGSSSGEEAYTLNFYAKENVYRMVGLTAQIDAFDIDADRIGMAGRGVYRSRSVREMGDEQARRYLHSCGTECYRVKDMYRDGVKFAIGNIIDIDSYRQPIPYDVVFCRNVLIYFSPEALRRAIDNFAAVLRPNGLLFLGHAESIIGACESLQPVRMGGSIVYRRVSP